MREMKKGKEDRGKEHKMKKKKNRSRQVENKKGTKKELGWRER